MTNSNHLYSQATTLIPRPNVKSSTSVPLMVKAVLPNIPSFAPTAPSSTKTTSSVTGGSTLIVQRPKVSMVATKRSPLSVTLPQVPMLTRPLLDPMELLCLRPTLPLLETTLSTRMNLLQVMTLLRPQLAMVHQRPLMPFYPLPFPLTRLRLVRLVALMAAEAALDVAITSEATVGGSNNKAVVKAADSEAKLNFLAG